jgi:hypothetical protein
MHGEEYETVWGEGEKDDTKKTSWRTKRTRAKRKIKGENQKIRQRNTMRMRRRRLDGKGQR